MINEDSPKLPELWSHQKRAIEIAKNRFALFFDPGCGKSRTAIELAKRSEARKAIIFAPLNVCRNWVNEIRTYSSPGNIYLVAGESKLKKMATLNDFKRDTCGILICNTESLRSKEYLDLLLKTGAEFVIADESHQFKSPSSLQTKGLITLVESLRPRNIYLLTGTPAPQGEMDLWSTLYLMQETRDSFFIWRKKHFEDKNVRRRGTRNYWPDYQLTDKGRKAIHEALARCSITARKNEVLDLPPLLRTVIHAEMSPAQKRQYETMKEYLFAIDEDGQELNAANVLVRTMRMQQILAGCLVADNPRLLALDAAIEKTNGEQFIIWTIFKDTYKDVEKLLESMDIAYGLITGEQTAEERHHNIERFQAGRVRALIANPKAGGIGVNLTAASYSIHYTRSFSLTDDLQCEARNYRGGSERHEVITRIDIVTPGTIDEEITEALREKKTVQDFILELKNGRYGNERTTECHG